MLAIGDCLVAGFLAVVALRLAREARRLHEHAESEALDERSGAVLAGMILRLEIDDDHIWLVMRATNPLAPLTVIYNQFANFAEACQGQDEMGAYIRLRIDD